MYCNKLMDIVQSEESEEYYIDKSTIKKLDIFIRKKTTQRERYKLNPMKFSAIMGIEQDTALMLFIIGIKVELFKIRKYYSCSCGEHFEIENISQPIYCYNCEKEIFISSDRDRIHLYFILVESPTLCSWNHQEKKYPLDYLEEYKNFTLADLDESLGEDAGNAIIGLSNMRENKMNEFLNEDS